jgi:hypothetical protein
VKRRTLNDVSGSDRLARPTSTGVKVVAAILAFAGGSICFFMGVSLPPSSSGTVISAVALVLGSCGVVLGGLTFRKPRTAGIIELPVGCLCVVQAIATMLLHTRGTRYIEGRSPSYFYLASAVLILSAAAIALGVARRTPRPTPTGGTP